MLFNSKHLCQVSHWCAMRRWERGLSKNNRILIRPMRCAVETETNGRQPNRPTLNASALNRNERNVWKAANCLDRTLIQIPTGPGRPHGFLHKLKVAQDPLCQCQCQSESVDHLLSSVSHPRSCTYADRPSAMTTLWNAVAFHRRCYQLTNVIQVSNKTDWTLLLKCPHQLDNINQFNNIIWIYCMGISLQVAALGP